MDRDRIIDQYADFLSQTPGDKAVRDVAELPYPREIIRAALLNRLRVERDPRMLGAMKNAYVALSSYQSMTPAERQAVDAMADLMNPPETGTLEEMKATAHRMAAVMPIVSKITDRMHADMKLFATDVAAIPS